MKAAEENPSGETSGSNSNKEDRPKFGPRPDLELDEFDFKTKLEKLPFALNIGEAPLTVEHKDGLFNLYMTTKRSSPFTTEIWGTVRKSNTVSQQPPRNQSTLPHRQIPIQLQSEVRKCLEVWLKASIIRPSKSPYASQVVIVRKKPEKFVFALTSEN